MGLKSDTGLNIASGLRGASSNLRSTMTRWARGQRECGSQRQKICQKRASRVGCEVGFLLEGSRTVFLSILWKATRQAHSRTIYASMCHNFSFTASLPQRKSPNLKYRVRGVLLRVVRSGETQ